MQNPVIKSEALMDDWKYFHVIWFEATYKAYNKDSMAYNDFSLSFKEIYIRTISI